MSEHQVNRSGVCEIPGCPCRGWSAQEPTMSKNEYQREQFPVGTIVEAIIPIGRGPMSDPFPVGTRGKVTSHCDDGRAWVFFDGEGHTFHEIERFVCVVQPGKEVSGSYQCSDCNTPRSTKDAWMCSDGKVRCGECRKVFDGQRTTITPQPAAQGGGDEWRVVELGQHTYVERDSRSDDESPFICDMDTGECSDVERIKARQLAAQIVTEHNQHQSHVAERERLREALGEMLNRFYPHTCDRGPLCAKCGALRAAQSIFNETDNQQRRTSE